MNARSSGALEIGAGQQHEQRRGIDAAIIAAERHFAELGHFAVPRFMQDLARLGVGGGVVIRRLVAPPDNATRPARCVGSSHSVSSAVMMPSRPNAVLNQGTPA